MLYLPRKSLIFIVSKRGIFEEIETYIKTAYFASNNIEARIKKEFSEGEAMKRPDDDEEHDIYLYSFYSMGEISINMFDMSNLTIIDENSNPDLNMPEFFPFQSAGKVDNGWDTSQALLTYPI